MTPREFGKPVSTSDRNRIPTEWWLRPVRRQALVGEQSGVTWKFVYRRPCAARASIVAVLISEPKQPKSAQPVSSRITTTMFGLASFWFALCGHDGLESATVSPIFPEKEVIRWTLRDETPSAMEGLRHSGSPCVLCFRPPHCGGERQRGSDCSSRRDRETTHL